MAIIGRLGQHEALDVQRSAVQPPEFIDLQKVDTCVHHDFTTTNRLAALGGIYLGACLHSCHIFSALLHPLLLCTDLRRPTVPNLAWGIAFLFTFMFQCIPVSGFWAFVRGYRKKCINPIVNDYYAVTTVILDVAILCIPCPIVWRLQMRLSQKFVVLAIFMLGGV